MKSNRIILIAAAGLSIAMLGSCNIYKKYELPTEDSALAKLTVKLASRALTQPHSAISTGGLFSLTLPCRIS